MTKSAWLLGALAIGGCQTDKSVGDTDVAVDTDVDAQDTLVHSDDPGDTEVGGDSDTDRDTDRDTDGGILTLADLSPGDVQIVEVMVDTVACVDAVGEYVEFVYRGSAPADLAGLTFASHNAATPPLPTFVVQPGERLLFGRSTALCPGYGVTANGAYTVISFAPTDEVVKVVGAGGTTLDTVDLAGRTANPGHAWSRDELTGTWCDATSLIGTTTDHGTPGSSNDPCVPPDTDTGTPGDTDTDVVGPDTDTGTAVDTDTDLVGPDTDTGPAPDTDTGADTDVTLTDTDTDTGTLDTVVVDTLVVDTVVIDTDLPILTVPELAPGDLRITEIASWPLACGADSGKFVEVQNRTSSKVDLKGLVFRSDAAVGIVSQTVQNDLILLPGHFVVFTRNGPGFASCYGTIPADLSFVSVRIADTDDRVVLENGSGVELADADYPFADGPVVQGHSKERDETDTWCDATSLAFGNDYATPGVANAPCVGRFDSDTSPPVDSDTDLPVDTVIHDTGVDTFTAPELTMDQLTRGSLRLTEVMSAPRGCPDGVLAQYFEVLNPGTQGIDLNGLEVDTVANTFVLKRHHHMAPGERLIFARDKAAFQACYGPIEAIGVPYQLSTSFEQIQLRAVLTAGGTRLLSDYVFTASFLPIGTALENDDLDPTTWCTADTPIGTTLDFGSPGAANGTCPRLGGDTARTDTAVGLPIPPRTLDQRLLITEVASFAGPPVLRWVEVTNVGPNPVPLDGWEIGRYSNGSRLGLNIGKAVLDKTITLQPGEAWWVGRESSAATWLNLFPIEPDQYSPQIAGDGNDAYTLEYHGIVVDVYGEVGVNGLGTNWDYTEALAQRSTDVRRPRTAFDVNEWYISPGMLSGTPSEHTFTSAPIPDTGLRASGAPLRTWDVAPGELHITEFLADPVQCADAQAEYIELTWEGTDLLELRGLTLKLGVIATTVTRPFTVVPGGRVIIARNATGFSSCYGSTADLQLDFGLKATGDVFRLVDSTGRILDTVDDTTWTVPPGAAWQLDAGGNWCLATQAIGATSDLGSPGQANETCP